MQEITNSREINYLNIYVLQMNQKQE